MRKSMKSLLAVIVLATPLALTSCEGTLDDILGEWSRPTGAETGGGTKTVAVTGITLSKTELTMKVGDTDVTLTATVEPGDATDKTVVWSSSKESVATVADGVVHAVAGGNAIITATAKDGSDVKATCTVTVLPEGALAGVFSVSATKKVWFSKGNLQAVIESGPTNTYNYTASSWKFADHQYDYIGNAAGNNSFDATTTVDLFGWVGISANYDTYGLCTDNSLSSVYYGTSTTDALKSDWGSRIGTGWSTLTQAEWTYLLDTRKVTVGGAAEASYGHGKVEGKNGLIILPDNWDGSVHASFTYGYSVWSNVYSSTSTPTWAQMEAAGAVFLPAAGCRNAMAATTVNNAGSVGYYWSSSPNSTTGGKADFLIFSINSSEYLNFKDSFRKSGFSVRLVYDAE